MSTVHTYRCRMRAVQKWSNAWLAGVETDGVPWMLKLADACRRLPWAKEAYAPPPGGSGPWSSRALDTLVEQVAVRYREARTNPRVLIQRMLQLESAVRSLCEYMGWSDRSDSISQSLESALGKEGREIALLGAAAVAVGVYQMVLSARAGRGRAGGGIA
jgi:hypothetical protein